MALKALKIAGEIYFVAILVLAVCVYIKSRIK